MKKHVSLVVMAAGMGSRFGGGIKQLEGVGPNGELILDYSVSAAMRAGFDRIIFVIRKDIEEDFNRLIGDRAAKMTDTVCVYQEMDDLPGGMEYIWDRKKPWGTGHAVLAARNFIKDSFAVINADDYYGEEAFRLVYDHLADGETENASCCMAAFDLEKTLSENGGVNRGVCSVDENGCLKSVKETYEIRREKDAIEAVDSCKKAVRLAPDTPVSMNMWGLTADFLHELETNFEDFLRALPADEIKAEYQLPTVIDACIREKKLQVKVLRTRDSWAGVTYREDTEAVVKTMREKEIPYAWMHKQTGDIL